MCIRDRFSPVFFGKEFTDCGILIRAITPIIVFKAWANVIRTQYLLPNEKDKDFIMSLFAGAIVNLIINSLLIPKLGAMGAVLGTVAAEGTVCIYQTVVVRKELNFRKYFRDSVTYLLIGGIMYVLVDQIGAKMKESILTLVTQIDVYKRQFLYNQILLWEILKRYVEVAIIIIKSSI